MAELTITPHGHLVVRNDGDAELPKSLLAAFAQGTAHGLLQLVTLERGLTPPFAYVRSLAQRYLAEFSRVVVNGEAIVPPDFAPILHEAPPTIGLEYLTADVLQTWWNELDALVRAEVVASGGNASDYLRQKYPQWRAVGRVTFHLAENKRNPDYPFAFLATFANGVTPQGKVRHEPLARSLEQFSGAKNRAGLVTLLTPVAKAAETVPWVKQLLESEDIYQPLAWAAPEAYQFLKSIPQLEASGLVVRVPDWWNARKPPRPQVNVKVNSGTTSGINVNALLEFSAEVSLEGESLSAAELAGLLASGSGLVSLRGKWIEIDADKLKQALKHWKGVEQSVRKDGFSFFEGMRLLSQAEALSAEQSEAAPTVWEWTGLSAGPELQATLDGLRAPQLAGEQAPPGFQAELRPYQRVGYGWLRFVTRLGLGACLADDMGLGKTIQIIALLLDLKRETQKQPCLLVVPASLVANWTAELTRFAPTLQYGVVHPSAAESAKITSETIRSFDLVITTYGVLTRTEWMKQPRWRLVILDEAQAIRNSGTKQTRAVKAIQAEGRIALTGTPVENRLSDVWSLFDFLNPGLLGSTKQFASFTKRLQQAVPPSFAPLRKLVQPYILRRMKTDKSVIADLPDKTEVDAWCPLSKHQAVLYQQAVQELAMLLQTASGIARRGIVLAQLMRLKQICNHPAQATGTNDFVPERSGKFQRLAEIACDIAARQEKLLVFTQFREMTAPIAEFLAGIFGTEGLVLHGGTAVKNRKALVERFQKEDGAPFFVLSLKAGGTGLNLTAASHVIHFDRWWNPAVENQATDRAFRIGQKRNVLVHKFICRGTVEERIDAMIREKSKLAKDVVGDQGPGAETLMTEWDNDTLLRFVKLDLASSTTDEHPPKE
jgi:superfamily II DNA or RNA helicase